jgi:hypothetical protein
MWQLYIPVIASMVPKQQDLPTDAWQGLHVDAMALVGRRLPRNC